MNAERPLGCLPQSFGGDRKAAPPNDAASFAELEFHPHPIGNGVQARVLYPNGYGASIVKFHGSYGGDDGLYELAVLCTDGEGLRITYDTPITDDVIGRLTPERVSELMAQVAALPLCKAD